MITLSINLCLRLGNVITISFFYHKYIHKCNKFIIFEANKLGLVQFPLFSIESIRTPIQVGQMALEAYSLTLNSPTQNLKTFKLIKHN